MDKQVIIAISREYGSGGHEIAKIIADDMGLNLYDRSLLDEIAKEKDYSNFNRRFIHLYRSYNLFNGGTRWLYAYRL